MPILIKRLNRNNELEMEKRRRVKRFRIYRFVGKIFFFAGSFPKVFVCFSMMRKLLRERGEAGAKPDWSVSLEMCSLKSEMTLPLALEET